MQSSLSGVLLKADSYNFWNSSWTRAQEDEADLLSVDLLSRAGYSPRGAVHGIQRLQSFEGSNVSQLQRYQAMQKQLFSQAMQKKGIGGLLEQGIQSGVTAAQLAAVDVWTDFGKTHQLPAQREEALVRYIASEYRSERRRSPQLASYQRQLLGGQSGKILAGQVLINRATKAIDNGDLNEARKLAKDVARGPAARSMRAQTLQFVSTGNAELGFVALSQVAVPGQPVSGSQWVVPEHLYTPNRQDAVLLKKGEGQPAAEALMRFMRSPQARQIIQTWGYGLAPAR